MLAFLNTVSPVGVMKDSCLHIITKYSIGILLKLTEKEKRDDMKIRVCRLPECLSLLLGSVFMWPLLW